jgi:hypothetical protein
MRVALLSVILMIIGAVMVGCTDNIIPCTVDEDCVMDWGWGGGDSDAADWGGDFGMVCNMDVSPLEECQEMLSYLDHIPDWLPILDWIRLPDCVELYGDLPEDTGVCDSSWGW